MAVGLMCIILNLGERTELFWQVIIYVELYLKESYLIYIKII